MQKTIPGSGRSPGGEYGNLLQYSCLENPMDRGTWQATVHRAAKSWTQLKRLSTHPYHAFMLQTPCQMFLCSLIQAYEISTRISFLQASKLKHRASYSVVSDFLQLHRPQTTRILYPWNSPGKNTGVGIHSLLKVFFLTQG